MKIGIFGGSFDPVHNEHIGMALSAKSELGLDRLYIVPAKVSPFKKIRRVASPTNRLNMLNLAFTDEDVIVSDYEIKKDTDSYTFETILHFRKFFPRDQLYFIMGGDNLASFKDWKKPEVIAKNADIVVIERKGEFSSIDEEVKKFKRKFGKNCIKLSYVGDSVSSTKVRIYESLGLSLDGLVPKAVEDYIKEHNIYAGNPYLSYIKENLTEPRLIHTANVMVAVLKKAEKEGINPDKALLAAALHDIAKYIDPETVEGFTHKGIPKQVVHAYLGAHILENQLGVTDKDVIDAVRYHTTAKAPMSKLAKLIFTADMIEDGRNYDGVERLRQIYYTKDLDTAFKECLKEEVLHLEQKGYELFGETRNAYEYYIKKSF